MVRTNDENSFQVPEDLFASEVKLPLTIAARRAFEAYKTTPPSRATLFRWIRKGKNGVRLESRRFNGNYQTSVEAIQRFIHAVDDNAGKKRSREDRRSTELDRVSHRLDDLGI